MTYIKTTTELHKDYRKTTENPQYSPPVLLDKKKLQAYVHNNMNGKQENLSEIGLNL